MKVTDSDWKTRNALYQLGMATIAQLCKKAKLSREAVTLRIAVMEARGDVISKKYGNARVWEFKKV